MAIDPKKSDSEPDRSQPPVQVPDETVGDAFPPEKDISTPPPGSDEGDKDGEEWNAAD